MQSGCAFLPEAAVLLDLTDTAVRNRNTESIDDVYIIAVVAYVHRTGVTADDIVMPMVVCRFVLHTVTLVQGRTHTAVTNKFKSL